ncbi:MAG: hypothetical protein FJX76_07555 [Armatimonadetes bacterium]|nr:hypothetical protein [Armatimonadota bacterium]
MSALPRDAVVHGAPDLCLLRRDGQVLALDAAYGAWALLDAEEVRLVTSLARGRRVAEIAEEHALCKLHERGLVTVNGSRRTASVKRVRAQHRAPSQVTLDAVPDARTLAAHKGPLAVSFRWPPRGNLLALCEEGLEIAPVAHVYAPEHYSEAFEFLAGLGFRTFRVARGPNLGEVSDTMQAAFAEGLLAMGRRADAFSKARHARFHIPEFSLMLAAVRGAPPPPRWSATRCQSCRLRRLCGGADVDWCRFQQIVHEALLWMVAEDPTVGERLCVLHEPLLETGFQSR